MNMRIIKSMTRFLFCYIYLFLPYFQHCYTSYIESDSILSHMRQSLISPYGFAGLVVEPVKFATGFVQMFAPLQGLAVYRIMDLEFLCLLGYVIKLGL